MGKRRTGLHKEVSSIFDGVPLPGNLNKKHQDDASDTENTGGGVSTKMPPEQKSSEHKPEHHQPRWPEPKKTTDAPEPAPTPEPVPTPQKFADKKKPAPEKPAPPKKIRTAGRTRTASGNLLQGLWLQLKTKVLTPKPGVDPKRHIATLVLMPILAIAFFSIVMPSLRSNSKQPSKAPTQSTQVVAASDGKINWKIPEPYPTNLRDPMRLGTTSAVEEKLDGPIVSGIVFNEKNPMAVIGAGILHEGEKVDGVTIKKIYADKVEFEQDGKTWTRRVGEH